MSVLREGKRERQWLSLDPLVARKVQAWIALRGSEPGSLLQCARRPRVFGARSVEVLLRYDDNRKDVGGEVASKVMRRISKLFNDEG